MRGGYFLLLLLAIMVLGVGSYLAVWYVGHIVTTLGVPCEGLPDRLRLAWLSSESSRAKRDARRLADWSAHKRARVRDGTASARYLDVIRADALIRIDESAAAIDLLDQVGEDGFRLGKLVAAGLVEMKWVLAAVKVGRYEQASRLMARVVAIRRTTVTLRVAAGVEFLVTGALERYEEVSRLAAAALPGYEGDDRRRLRRQDADVVMAARGDRGAFEELRAATIDFVSRARADEGGRLDRMVALAALGRWAVLMGRGDVVGEVALELEAAPMSHPFAVGKLVEFRGLRLALAGDHDGARRAFDEVRQIADAQGYRPMAAELRLAEAALALRAGDPAAARAAVSDAVDRFRSMGGLGGVRECETVARLLGLDPPVAPTPSPNGP